MKAASELPPAALNWIGVRYAILFWFTVFQSSARMPPVSPELGFHDQNVQLMPWLPAAMSLVPLLSRSPEM